MGLNRSSGWLERVGVDWNDFDEAGRTTREIAHDLAADPSLLRLMVLEARSRPALRRLAEKHNELHYIVIHDALDRGLRVRLHRFSKGLEDDPHNHRFSFSSLLLAGSYEHSLYELDPNADERGTRWELRQPEGSHGSVRVEEISFGSLAPTLRTIQSAGSSYSLHHRTIHKTAMPTSDAFSLFIRGPAAKPCALQLQPESRSYRWKFGRDREAPRLVAERGMSDREFDEFIESLEAAGII